VNTLLLDKTARSRSGIARPSNSSRQGVSETELADAAQLSSLATRRRKGARWWSWQRASTLAGPRSGQPRGAFIPFSAYTRMSGVDIDDRGCARRHGGDRPLHPRTGRRGAAGSARCRGADLAAGRTPLAVADGAAWA